METPKARKLLYTVYMRQIRTVHGLSEKIEMERYRSSHAGRSRMSSTAPIGPLEDCLKWTMDWYKAHNYTDLHPTWCSHKNAWTSLPQR